MTESQNNLTDNHEKQSAKFAIDLLPISNLNDKFSYLSNLSIFSGGLIQDQIKKLGCLNHNGTHLRRDTSENKELINNLQSNGYGGQHTHYETIDKSGCLLFRVKEVSIFTDTIIITSTDNKKYIAKIEDYLQSGLLTLTMVMEADIANLKAQKRQSDKYTIEGGLLSIKSKQLLNIGADDYCVNDESKNQLCILKDNKIALYEYDDDSIDRKSDYFDLSVYGAIKNIRTDVNNNFYFIIAENGGQSELKILNRNTLEEVMSFKDLTEIVYLSNEQGKLFCMDKNGFLRIVTVNTKSLERGYVDKNEINAETTAANIIKIEDKPRSELKNILSGGGIKLSGVDEDEEIGEGVDVDDSQLRDQIRNSLIDGTENKTLKNIYEEANSPQEIEMVYKTAQQLKKNPHVMAVKGLIDPIITTISNKRNKIKLIEMSQQLMEINKDLSSVNDFASMSDLKLKLTQIKQTRSQILIVDKEIDTLLKDTIKVVDEKIQEYQSEHKEEMLHDIEDNLGHISGYMGGIDYLLQITSIYSTDLWKQTEQMLSYLDEENRKLYKKKMADIVSARQIFLNKQAKSTENEGLQKQEENINEIKNNLTSLKGILESINDEDTIKDMQADDPLVINIRNKIETLPANKGQELDQRLEQIFRERLLSVQFNKDSNNISLKSLDQYGIPRSISFVPDVVKKVKREISAKQGKDGLFKLQFISSAGNVIDPSINKKIIGNFKFSYTFQERQELKSLIGERNSNGSKKKFYDLQKKIAELKKEEGYEKNEEFKKTIEEFKKLEIQYYIPRMLDIMNKISGEGKLWNLNTRKYLPSIDNKTVITQTIQESLAKRGRILSQQLQYRQGIMIVESEAGTGKNFKCDILGHLTNREVFDVSCNEYMEKEDLLFSPEIDNDGTHRKPSKLVQGLQTPGAIIVLDEINTLKPGVSKLLNPLLDGRRYINDPQMGRIYAHPSVIIIGLMNPRYYRGTKELPQEFVSRARMTDDKYPQKNEEAFMISRYLEGPLGKLSQEEFNHYRSEYIEKGEIPSDKKIYNIFVALNKVVKVAEDIRKIYSKTMKGDAGVGEELNYIFTIRDGNYVIQDFNYTKDIQKSLEDIVLMKISDPEQKEFAKKIIEEGCR